MATDEEIKFEGDIDIRFDGTEAINASIFTGKKLNFNKANGTIEGFGYYRESIEMKDGVVNLAPRTNPLILAPC